ncbi:NAD(P)/FAD-dependent oxidoreductase [Devosia sp. A16]|uniref:NAD(P)/FAD-dependent oxidoreductase n=1 Tax=Devosia sp. A16 TaxID=1736675 RepID=UPI000A834551|nr:FAD-dependent oxidoreductase [Devosia sp. A16]
MRHFHEDQARASGRRIAIIGAGIAGLSAAWLLSRRHEVVLYEANAWLGGHANTVDVDCPEGQIAVDTGFIVFNPGNYPNFTALLEHLQVASLDSDMSLGVSVGDGRLEYSSRPFGLFGQKRNLVNPRFWRMIADIVRFYEVTRNLEEDAVEAISLGEFLDRGGWSRALIDEHVLPMCAAIWSTTSDQMRHYPMRSFLRFFTSHGLLQVTNRPQWRTVLGGSRSYVEALLADIGTSMQRRAKAIRVRRQGGLVMVDDAAGGREVFTDVVIGAHADEALRMLEDPSADEQAVLGAFRYTPNVAVLHDDPALMPRRRSVWASWNYIGSDESAAERPLCVSYWMNHLQSLRTRRQLFLTLNPSREPRQASVIRTFEYTHPLFDHAALAAQNELWRLQGARNTWFCGSYFGYGFHEDALQSGLAVAARFGIAPPWAVQHSRIARAPAVLEAAR